MFPKGLALDPRSTILKVKQGKYIRLGINVLNVVDWGTKLSVLWSQSALCSLADMLAKDDFFKHKTDDLLSPK